MYFAEHLIVNLLEWDNMLNIVPRTLSKEALRSGCKSLSRSDTTCRLAWLCMPSDWPYNKFNLVEER
jgi:hypothetical protein